MQNTHWPIVDDMLIGYQNNYLAQKSMYQNYLSRKAVDSSDLFHLHTTIHVIHSNDEMILKL